MSDFSTLAYVSEWLQTNLETNKFSHILPEFNRYYKDKP